MDIWILYMYVFSRMRSKGFSFYILGVWGWTRVRVTLLFGVRNRPQPSVRDRRETKVAIYGESYQNVSFLTCQKMWSCSFVWQAWNCVTFDVFQEECVCVCARPS